MSKHKENIFKISGCLSMEQMMDYVHNRLSMKGRNKVERHLQECGLCEEAMEGFYLLKGKERETRAILSDIDKSLTAKVTDAKIRWMAAASLAVAVLAGGIMYLNTQLNPDTTRSEVSVVSQDTIRENAPKEISGNLSRKDSFSMNKKEELSDEKISFNTTKEEKDISRQYEVTSDAFLAPSEINEEKEEKVIPAEKPSENTFGAGNAMKDTFLEPNASFDLSEESKEMDREEVVIAAKKAETKYNYNDSDKKKLKKRTSVPHYRSTPDEKSKSKSEMFYGDFDDSNSKKDVKTEPDGINSYKNKDYKEAIVVLEEVLKFNPDSTDALYYNGLSHFELKNYNKALSNFEKILKGNKYYEDAVQMKAKIYIVKGEKEKAKQILQQIIDEGGKHKVWAEEEMKKLEDTK